jgi:hypothetical protein
MPRGTGVSPVGSRDGSSKQNTMPSGERFRIFGIADRLGDGTMRKVYL